MGKQFFGDGFVRCDLVVIFEKNEMLHEMQLNRVETVSLSGDMKYASSSSGISSQGTIHMVC